MPGNEVNDMELRTYKPHEFAKLIGVTVKTLQRWDREGILQACRTPTNRRYYTHEQYEDYMRSGRRNMMSG